MALISLYEGDGFSFSHSIDTSPEDSHFPLHIHSELELFCLVKGDVGYIVEGHKYKLYPGTVLLMRSGESHKLLVKSSEEYERYVINFSADFVIKRGFSLSILDPYFQRELGQKNRYTLKNFNGFSPVLFCEKIERECSVVKPENAVLSNLSSLLSAINVAYLDKSNKETDESNLIAFVNNNLTTDISVSEIAEYAHLSPSQLSRVFKDLTGISVHEYILSKRLILFHEKLRQGKPAIKASAECGFHDYSSFYRLYKKRYGKSPTHDVIRTTLKPAVT